MSNTKRPSGYILSVALHGARPSDDDSATFLYTGPFKTEPEIMAEFRELLNEAIENDETLVETIYNWADFVNEVPDILAKHGYIRLWPNSEMNIHIYGAISLGFDCDEPAVKDYD